MFGPLDHGPAMLLFALRALDVAIVTLIFSAFT